MNPQVDRTSGLGLPQPGSDMSQLPPIHAPQTFHAPENPTSQFGLGSPAPTLAPAEPSLLTQSPIPNAGGAVQVAPPSVDALSVVQEHITNSSTIPMQGDDADTPFDEEWASKAKQIVDHTHADPYLQSRELSRLKAQYIKARYNKDIKISED